MMEKDVCDQATEVPWRAYREALYRFVLNRVADDAAAAEDIVQDVLAKAYAQHGALREPSKLRAWLYQITRNAITDYFRSHRRLETIPETLAEDAGNEYDERAKQELARCLLPLLDTLPEAYRRALTLAEFEGLKQQEVASRLGLSLSGAKSRVQRGRAMLQDALLKCCRVELDHRGYAVAFQDTQGCDKCAVPGDDSPRVPPKVL